MTALADLVHVTTKETNVWRECAGCGATAAMPPGLGRCEQCQAPTRASRPRADAGRVRLTERDLGVFGWLSEMKAIYEDDLPGLLERMPGTAWTRAGRRPSPPRVRNMLARWQRAGYAEARRLVTGTQRVVRLMRAGAALVGADNFRETAPLTAYHQCDVTRVRLTLEGRPSPTLGDLTHWESERSFRADLDALGLARRGQTPREQVHVPDGIATYAGGQRVAIEVERSVKAPVRLACIVEQLLTTYPVTLYVVSGNEIRNALAAAERSARDALTHRQLSADRIGALSVIDMPGQVA